MAESLVQEFESAVRNLYRQCVREINYHARAFLDMVTMMGAVEATRVVINASEQPEGFLRLWREKRLDLSVEALVVENPRFHSLFTTEEIERANKRLIDAGYEPKLRRKVNSDNLRRYRIHH